MKPVSGKRMCQIRGHEAGGWPASPAAIISIDTPTPAAGPRSRSMARPTSSPGRSGASS